jgi:hypothetical protein
MEGPQPASVVRPSLSFDIPPFDPMVQMVEFVTQPFGLATRAPPGAPNPQRVG